jgi:hypothetical protein
MWIEWFSISILFLGTLVFGWLSVYSVERGLEVKTFEPIIYTTISAVVAALRDLTQQELYSRDKDHKESSFDMKTLRIQAGGIIFTILVMPILSLIGTRPKDVIWLARPLEKHCEQLMEHCMESKSFLNLPGIMKNITECAEAAGACSGTCDCSSGVFRGWQEGYAIYAFLFFSIYLSYVIAQVMQLDGGAMLRTRLEGGAVVPLYWIAQPFMYWCMGNHGNPVKDLCLDLVSFVVPLASLMSVFGMAETKPYVEEKVAFGMGLIAGLWSRVRGEQVSIIVSDAGNPRFSKSWKRSKARKSMKRINSILTGEGSIYEVSLRDTHHSAPSLRGPYVMLANNDKIRKARQSPSPFKMLPRGSATASPAQDTPSLLESESELEDDVTAATPDDWPQAFIRDIDRLLNSAPRTGLEVFKQLAQQIDVHSQKDRQTNVRIGVRCAKAAEYEHVVEMAKLGVAISVRLGCNNNHEEKPTVLEFGVAQRKHVLNHVALAREQLNQFCLHTGCEAGSEEVQAKLLDVEEGMKVMDLERKLAPPYLEYVIEERYEGEGSRMDAARKSARIATGRSMLEWTDAGSFIGDSSPRSPSKIRSPSRLYSRPDSVFDFSLPK